MNDGVHFKGGSTRAADNFFGHKKFLCGDTLEARLALTEVLSRGLRMFHKWPLKEGISSRRKIHLLHLMRKNRPAGTSFSRRAVPPGDMGKGRVGEADKGNGGDPVLFCGQHSAPVINTTGATESAVYYLATLH